MKLKWFIISLVLKCSIFGATFHDDLIPVTFNNKPLDKPFLGGANRPKIQWVDWDNDSDIDLFLLDAGGYIRFIENQGTVNLPDFKLITVSFQDIYCGGWFYFSDFDDDGKIDLMTQNSEDSDNISYYKNIGNQLFFYNVLKTISDIYITSSSVMTPTFADIDNDGDLDFFTGNMTGSLNYYENQGVVNNIPQFEYITNSWQDIYIVGGVRTDDRHGASAITFIDLDGDGDLDLSWGDYFQQSLYIIWNSGTASDPIMIEVTTQYPPENPVVSAGQNMPTFADLDNDGDEDLFVTVLSGAYGNQLINNFFYYENIGSNSNPEYVYITNNYFSMLDVFSNSRPEMIDFDNDGDLDLFIANQYDLAQTPWIGKIHFFRNTGSNSDPIYIEESTSLLYENMGQMLSPEFGDLDADGYIDLVVGDFNGFIKYYKNISVGNEIDFVFVENIANIDLSGNSVPALGDLDSDGDLDLLIGQLNGELLLYRNQGSELSYNFQEEIINIGVESNSAPDLFDIDADGDLDLLLGTGSGKIKIYYNYLSTDASFYIMPHLEIQNLGLNIKPAAGNLFDLETLDIIVGLSIGGLYHIEIKPCVATGDLNGDGGYNVLDIVFLANCVLVGNCNDIDNACSADLNGDGGYNVLDIVFLANCVLAGNCNN